MGDLFREELLFVLQKVLVTAYVMFEHYDSNDNEYASRTPTNLTYRIEMMKLSDMTGALLIRYSIEVKVKSRKGFSVMLLPLSNIFHFLRVLLNTFRLLHRWVPITSGDKTFLKRVHCTIPSATFKFLTLRWSRLWSPTRCGRLCILTDQGLSLERWFIFLLIEVGGCSSSFGAAVGEHTVWRIRCVGNIG